MGNNDDEIDGRKRREKSGKISSKRNLLTRFPQSEERDGIFFHRSNKKCPQSMKDEIKNFRGEIGKPCASSYSNRYRASRFKWWWERRRRICVLIGVSLSNHQGTRHFTHFLTSSLECQFWGKWQDLSPLFKFNLGFLRVMTFSEILLRGETNLHKYVLSNLW